MSSHHEQDFLEELEAYITSKNIEDSDDTSRAKKAINEFIEALITNHDDTKLVTLVNEQFLKLLQYAGLSLCELIGNEEKLMKWISIQTHIMVLFVPLKYVEAMSEHSKECHQPSFIPPPPPPLPPPPELKRLNSDQMADVKLVASQAGCTNLTAARALQRVEWDIVNAIMDLTC